MKIYRIRASKNKTLGGDSKYYIDKLYFKFLWVRVGDCYNYFFDRDSAQKHINEINKTQLIIIK